DHGDRPETGRKKFREKQPTTGKLQNQEQKFCKEQRDRQCRRSEQNSWYASNGDIAGEQKHLRVLKFTAPYQEDRLSGRKYSFTRS
ncbi:hypothetical protein, partial [Streptococcus pneumoniae]|uniref:hypothetical protein n=1 Tax=Streptococcus pneumoniae TaxID=1313 RepID=UPI0019514073